jgi:hypothetical protein
VPASGDLLRGLANLRCLIVNEAAWVPEEIFHVISPFRASNPRCQTYYISSAGGRSGTHFNAMNDPEWERYTIRAMDCPERISPEFLEQERRSLPEQVYLREYCCDFNSDGAFQYIATDLIERSFDNDIAPLRLPLFT